MAYIALYRKYRPEKFAEVVGQEHVKRTLMNAAKKEQLSHAYLFSGPRGTGKTTVARILARAANCTDLRNGEPCGECENCESISSGVWGIVEIDGASHNSVEDIRELQEVIHHVPMRGQYTVYIIDEVHMLSRPAFNAFLKTLEEPPTHTKFILATTEPYRLPKTILSRCQHFAFTHISLEKIKEQVEQIAGWEKVQIAPDAAEFLALHGRGSMRDTISLLDQALIYCGDNIDLNSVKELIGAAEETIISDIVDAMINYDSTKLMELVDQIIVSGQDLPEISSSIIQHMRNVMLVKAGVKNERILGFVGSEFPRLEKQAEQVDEPEILRSIEYLGEAHSKLKFDIDQRLGFETSLLGTMAILNDKYKSGTTKQTTAKAKQTQTATAAKPEKPISSFPQRKPSQRQSNQPADTMVPDFLKSKTDTDSPMGPTQKKTPDENFPGFWNEFNHWLKSTDLPLAILIRGIQANYDKNNITLTFSDSEDFRFNFAKENKIRQRLQDYIKQYSSKDLTISLAKCEKKQLSSEPDPLPGMEVSFQRSEKVKMENMVKENFMSLFPDGELKWDDSAQL